MPLRKIVMLDPGFREKPEPSVLRPRIFGIYPPSHPRDRRNVKFVVLALIVAVILFATLQYRQLHEVEDDTKRLTKSPVNNSSSNSDKGAKKDSARELLEGK